MDEPENVKQLIEMSCKPQYRLGSGNHGTTYSLAHIPGLEDYAMRIAGSDSTRHTPSDILRMLETTTTLHQPATVIGKANIGQTLLQTAETIDNKPFVSFMLRQQGVSLHELWEPHNSNAEYSRDPMVVGKRLVDARMDVYQQIRNAATQTGSNPFLSLIEMRDDLTRQGYCAQCDSKNILWDSKTKRLSFVDQLVQDALMENTTTLRKCFAYGSGIDALERDPALSKKFYEAQDAVFTLIDEAERTQAETIRSNGMPRKFTKLAPASHEETTLAERPDSFIKRLHRLRESAQIEPGL